MHRLVIVDRHANDRTGDPRGDADDVGADLAIAGPGSLQVAIVKGPGRPGGQSREGKREEIAEQLCSHGKNSAPISELNRITSARKHRGRCQTWRARPARSRIVVTSHAVRKPRTPMVTIQGTRQPA